MTLAAIAQKIISLRWEKQFEKVLEIYKNEVHGKFAVNEVIGFTKLVTAIADSLKETARPGKGIHFLENTMRINPGDNTPAELIKCLGWLYFFALNSVPPQVSFTESKRRQYFPELLKQLLERAEPVLFELLFFRCIEALLKQLPLQGELAESLFQKFDSSCFSQTGMSRSIKIGAKVKEIDMAGGFEKWYMLKSKTHYCKQQYQLCIETCRHALANIAKFHHGNQIWIIRRMALCYKQLGDFSLAVHEFEKLIKRKNDWFIQKELAELYFLTGKLENAIELASKSLLNGGYSEYKVGLIEFMGGLFLRKEEPEAANDFYACAAAIRKEKSWPIPLALRQVLSKQGVEESLPGEKLFKKLEKHATTYCHSIQLTERYHGNGVVTRVLHEGENGDGFITCSQGRSVYFRFCNTRMPWQLIKNESPVSFVAIRSQQQGKTGWKAVKVFSSGNKKNIL